MDANASPSNPTRTSSESQLVFTPTQLALAVDQASMTTKSWQLSEAARAALFDISVSTLKRWESEASMRKFSGRMSQDQLSRLGYLLGIQKSLRMLFTNPEMEAEWMTSPNVHPVFSGAAPITLALRGHQGLRLVCQHLNAALGH